MYDLITFKAGFGNVSFSPFCVKSIWMLNHAGVAWQRTDTPDPRKYEHGKLPVLRVGDRVISDSDNIRLFLEQHGTDFWGATSARDQAMGRALIRMAEDHMYFHVVIDRWFDDRVWPTVRGAYFSDMPKIVRGIVTSGIRKALRKGLNAQGLLRLSADQRLVWLDQDLAAIRTLLDQHSYILGETPTLPDFSVASILSNFVATPVETASSLRVTRDPVLMAYINRMKEMFD